MATGFTGSYTPVRNWSSAPNRLDPESERQIREGIRMRGPIGTSNAVFHQSLGRFIDPKTGFNFTGTLTGSGGQKITNIKDGVASGDATNPEDDFPKLIKTVQQPEAADYAQGVLAGMPKHTADTMTAFGKLMADQNKETAGFRASADDAYDPSKTIATIGEENKKYESRGADTVSQLEKNAADYESRQEANQAAKQGILDTQAEQIRAARDLSVSNANRALAGSRLVAGGANANDSGVVSSRAQRNYLQYAIPAEERISGLRMGLADQGTGLNREYLGNRNAVVQVQQGLYDRFRDNAVGAAQYAQGLSTALRSANLQEALQLFSREGDLLGLGQRLQRGEIDLAQAAQILEAAATNYTYSQPFDPSRIAPTASYDPVAPTPNYRPRNDDRTTDDAIGRRPEMRGGRPGIDRPPTFEEIQAARQENARRYVPPQVAPMYQPNYRTPTETGWGFSNGEYIGKDAENWNAALTGT